MRSQPRPELLGQLTAAWECTVKARSFELLAVWPRDDELPSIPRNLDGLVLMRLGDSEVSEGPRGLNARWEVARNTKHRMYLPQRALHVGRSLSWQTGRIAIGCMSLTRRQCTQRRRTSSVKMAVWVRPLP